MAIKELTEKQVREMTIEEKDRWWLENVYRGDMKQLTVRSALTGMILGAILSLSNLYIGAKVGVGFGVATTAVVLAFAMFRGLSRIGLATDMTLLENNCMQSIATAAGYMTSGLISSLPAYMAITGEVIPIWQATLWLISISLLGVLFAFPLKRRFINDEQLLFPEGRAAGRVMDALHDSDNDDGLFKARILGAAAAIAAVVTVLQEVNIKKFLHMPFSIPEELEKSLAWISEKLSWLSEKLTWSPTINGLQLQQLGVSFGIDTAMFGLGALMGIRIGLSFMVGAIVNYCIVAPIAIGMGEVQMTGDGSSYKVLSWSVWAGVAILTTASLTPFFLTWRGVVAPIRRIFSKRESPVRSKTLSSIELPMSVFIVGIPLVGAAVVALGHWFFGIEIWLGIVAIPLVFVFTLIAVNTTGYTGQTPTGAMGKLTQLTFAGLAPNSITTNIMTAGIASDTALNASSLLQDIKPGYMLGAKPRLQAIGHVLGILAGGIAATFAAYQLFIPEFVEHGASEEYPMAAAVIWTSVAKMLTGDTSAIPNSAINAAIAYGLVGIAIEILRRRAWPNFPLSPVGIGFAMVIPFMYSFTIFAGAFCFWIPHLVTRKGSKANRIFVENHETLCSGLIAGASLAGISVAIVLAKWAGASN